MRTHTPALLYVLVAISGAAGLGYELLWIRALGLHFGTTTPAITTVVATFMAGLAAARGSWQLLRRVTRGWAAGRLGGVRVLTPGPLLIVTTI